jgi:hypothetical protein
VCDCLGDSLKLRATGMSSGLIAYALFSDGVPITVTAGTNPACIGSSVTLGTSLTGSEAGTSGTYTWYKGSDLPTAQSAGSIGTGSSLTLTPSFSY